MSEFQALLVSLFGFVLLIIFAYTFIAGFFRSPFVPSNRPTVRRMLELARIKKGERVFDLGCGDGRLVIAAEKRYGANATGYEISGLVWLFAQINKLFHGAHAKIYCRNFFKADLKKADVVFCYLLPEAMAALEPKFQKELKKGARVISAAFKLPHWKPFRVYEKAGRVEKIYEYRVEGRVASGKNRGAK